MILHPVISDIAVRREALAEAIRKGHLTPELSRYTQPGWAYLYKDASTPSLAFAKAGNTLDAMSSDDDGSIAYVVTTDDEDRDGDVVRPLGIQLKNYSQNPVVFFGHQEWEIPIGVCRSFDGRITVYPEDNRVVEVIYFDRADPDADFIYGKCKRKVINATSIAFVPIEAWKRDDVQKARQQASAPPGWFFNMWDQTEVSCVGVPSNPKAVGLEKDLQGACRDVWDREHNDMSPKLQKAWQPYCAVTKGVWRGWTPCPEGTCRQPDGSCSTVKSVTKDLADQARSLYDFCAKLNDADYKSQMASLQSALGSASKDELAAAWKRLGFVGPTTKDKLAKAIDARRAIYIRSQLINPHKSEADVKEPELAVCTKCKGYGKVKQPGVLYLAACQDCNQTGLVAKANDPSVTKDSKILSSAPSATIVTLSPDGRQLLGPGSAGGKVIYYSLGPGTDKYYVDSLLASLGYQKIRDRAWQKKSAKTKCCDDCSKGKACKCKSVKKDINQADSEGAGIPGRNANPPSDAKQEKDMNYWRTQQEQGTWFLTNGIQSWWGPDENGFKTEEQAIQAGLQANPKMVIVDSANKRRKKDIASKSLKTKLFEEGDALSLLKPVQTREGGLKAANATGIVQSILPGDQLLVKFIDGSTAVMPETYGIVSGKKSLKKGSISKGMSLEEWKAKARQLPGFVRFATANQSGQPPYGSGSTTIHALDKNGQSIGWWSLAYHSNNFEKALGESSGMMGGYAAAPKPIQANDAKRDSLDETVVEGWASCTTCHGDGNCNTCGGTGEVAQLDRSDKHDCKDCGGSGECGDCAGQGHIKKGVKKAASASSFKVGDVVVDVYDPSRPGKVTEVTPANGGTVRVEFDHGGTQTYAVSGHGVSLAQLRKKGLVNKSNQKNQSLDKQNDPTVPQVLAALYSHAKAEQSYIDQLGDTHKDTLAEYRDQHLDERMDLLKGMFSKAAVDEDLDKMCKAFEDGYDRQVTDPPGKGFDQDASASGVDGPTATGENLLINQGDLPDTEENCMPKSKVKAGACLCSDSGCPVHKGQSSCSKPAKRKVYRSDMEDRTGTPMCDGCASDALNSGVFYTKGNKTMKENTVAADGGYVEGDSDAAGELDAGAAPFNKSADRDTVSEGDAPFNKDFPDDLEDKAGDPGDDVTGDSDPANQISKDDDDLVDKAGDPGDDVGGDSDPANQISKDGGASCPCGADAPPGSNFCPGCGQPVGGDAAAPVTAGLDDAVDAPPPDVAMDIGDDPTAVDDPLALDKADDPTLIGDPVSTPKAEGDATGNDPADPNVDEILERYRNPKSNKWDIRKWHVHKKLMPFIKYRVAANGVKYLLKAGDVEQAPEEPSPDALKSATNKLAKAIDDLKALYNSKSMKEIPEVKIALKHVADQIWYVGKELTDAGKLQRNGGSGSALSDKGKLQHNPGTGGDKGGSELFGGSLESRGSQQGKAPAKSWVDAPADPLVVARLANFEQFCKKQGILNGAAH